MLVFGRTYLICIFWKALVNSSLVEHLYYIDPCVVYMVFVWFA